uniref:Aa_trans domain-containing protein n=1 Tax=Panagrellus redivivus TaxID=6233 RepID=A0A7E4ZXT1_PANRE
MLSTSLIFAFVAGNTNPIRNPANLVFVVEPDFVSPEVPKTSVKRRYPEATYLKWRIFTTVAVISFHTVIAVSAFCDFSLSVSVINDLGPPSTSQKQVVKAIRRSPPRTGESSKTW